MAGMDTKKKGRALGRGRVKLIGILTLSRTYKGDPLGPPAGDGRKGERVFFAPPTVTYRNLSQGEKNQSIRPFFSVRLFLSGNVHY